MPRKSAASAAAPASPTTANGETSLLSNATEPKSPVRARHSTSKNDDIGIDDLLLPRSLTTRLARGVLPANTSIQKDATLALTKSATVFISYLAAHANEQTTKKTIGAQDVLNALREIEFGSIVGLDGPGTVGEDGVEDRRGRLEKELEVFETAVSAKRKGYRDKVKQRESGVGNVGDGDQERGEPDKKRARKMSDDEELLDAQLNGPDGSGEVNRSPLQGLESRVNGFGTDQNDETEDDPDVEEDDEDEEEEDDDDEEQDQIETQDEDRVGMDDHDDRRDGERSRLGLAPNGRVELGSEDESD